MVDASVCAYAMLFGSLDWGELLFSTVSFVTLLVVLSVVFYLAGVIIVGRGRALFKDAVAVSVLGTLVLIVCLTVFSLEVAVVLSLVAWLLLVRHYYETGLLGSVAVGLTSVFVSVVVLVLLGLLLGYSAMLFRWLPIFAV
ncbi:MAG: hypothetical protein WC325_07855 [Candidatus Bathyarchaeia archaeon]|jgi:hypothetical protein